MRGSTVEGLSHLLRLCTPFSVPVDIFAAVEWKKSMWCLFRYKAPTLFFVVVAVAVVKVVCLVKKSLEARVKDARMPAFYRSTCIGACERV